MDPTTLRNALGFLRRQWWVIAQAMVIIGAVTAFMSTRQSEPEFEATSSVRIFVSGGGTSDVFKPTAQSILNEQIRVLTSGDVINAAAGASDLPSAVVAGSINASSDPTTGIIYARVHHPDRVTAVTVANNLTRAYVSERVSNQREDLQGKATELDDRIASLNASIADLETRIVAAGATLPLADVPTALADGPSASVPATTTTVAQIPEVQQLIEDLVIDRGNLATALAERQINRKDLLSPPKLAEVESSAADAFQPAKKSPIKQGLLGVVIGMVVGAGLAVLRELLDDRIHTRHDLEKASGKAIIAELPYDSASASSRRNSTVALASIERPHDALAESIRQLRTSISFLAVDQPIGCVTITSAEPDEGKSLVAANLAVAFAQAGVRTILVSGDLRRPSLDARMLPADARGFSDLIMSRVDLGASGGVLTPAGMSIGGAAPVTAADVMFNTKLPGLRFVPVGTLPPNPAELLASKAAAQAVRDLREQCEMLIIDSPPTLVTDGVILANLADAAILVTALSQSHKTRIAAAISSLSGGHVRVLGVVLNKVSVSSTGYRSYAPIGGADTGRRRGRKRYETPLVTASSTPSGAAVTPAMQPSLFPGGTMQRPPAPGPQVVSGASQPIVTNDTTPSVPVRTPPPLLPPPPPAPPASTGKLNGKNGAHGTNGANGTHLNGLNGSNGARIPSDVPLGKAAGTEGRS